MDKTASRLYTIFFGLVILTLSSIYMIPSGIKLNLLLYPQVGVFAILGFFHAINLMDYKIHDSKKDESTAYVILDLFSDWLIYTAWYNIILFPLSGFGVIEWTGVFFILVAGFISDFSTKKLPDLILFAGHSPINLLITGVALYLLKITVFYLLPANIYLEAFHGNNLARLILVFFCICGLATLISLLIKNIKNNLYIKKQDSETSKKSKKAVSEKIISSFWKGLKRFFTFLTSIFSGPVLIIVILMAGLLTLGIGAAFALGIYNNLLKFIDPFMENLLKTGKTLILPSKLYCICQTVSLIAVLFYTILNNYKIFKK